MIENYEDFIPLAEEIFLKYANSLPGESNMNNPKMDYYMAQDAVIWEDEGIVLSGLESELANLIGFVVNYRTFLITNVLKLDIDKNNVNKKVYELAKIHFPDWIGFKKERCSFNPQHADRIARLRVVANWRFEKLLKESDESEL